MRYGLAIMSALILFSANTMDNDAKIDFVVNGDSSDDIFSLAVNSYNTVLQFLAS